MPKHEYPLGKLLTETDYAEDRMVDGKRCMIIKHLPTGLEVVCQGTGKRAWSLGMADLEYLILKCLDEEALLDSMHTQVNPCPV